jgi:phage shock protein PspC (stress-responsive transcriptional regulator)
LGIAHFPVLLILVFLGGLFIASRMIDGYYPPMVYQFAFSAMISLVAGGLSTQAPVDATILRIILTLFGAIAAAFMTVLLEQIFIRSVGTTAEASR